MRIVRVSLFVALIALLGCGGGSTTTPPSGGAIAVSMTPVSANVQTGATQQFTPTVTGTSNNSVNWSVNGTAGGNSTVGTISSSGLYTAPASVPSPNPVTVSATSAADSTKSASASVTITVPASTIVLTISPTSASVQTGARQQFTATVTGTSNTTVNWSVNGTAGGNSTVGTISNSGLYTAPASVPSPNPVTVTATSAADSTKSKSATVTVTGPPPPPTLLTITSGAPLGAATGTAFSFPFTAAGGTPPYTWSASVISPDTLTNGLNIDPNAGKMSGTPIFAGIIPLAVTVSDSIGNTMTVEYDLIVGGAGSPNSITNTPINGTQDSAYAFRFSTTWTPLLGCSADMLYMEGSLPPGLTFNTLSGDIGNPPASSGTPTTAGSYTITVSASPGSSLCANPPTQTNSQTFTIQIAPASPSSAPDGASNWARQNSGTPVLAPGTSGWDAFAVESPSVIKAGSQFLMYYEGEDLISHLRQVGMATSSDGVKWVKSSSNPVLKPGGIGAWDALEVRFPVVEFDGTTYRMWYRGWNGNATTPPMIGLATSSDGVTWTKASSNPVFGGAFGGYMPGSVILNSGTFQMWYSSSTGPTIGLATSPDGVTWNDLGNVTVPGSPPSSLSGRRPAVTLNGTTYTMWFSQKSTIGAGIVAGSPIQNGTIAFASSPDGINWTPYTQNLNPCFFCIITETTIPVLGIGPAGAFDRPGVGDASVMLDGTVFRMWYAGGLLYTSDSQGLAWVAGSIGYATTQ